MKRLRQPLAQPSSTPSPHVPRTSRRTSRTAPPVLAHHLSTPMPETPYLEPFSALASEQTRASDAARRILIVEDDILCARMIREALWMEGDPHWDIQLAFDGESALAFAAAQLPNIILLDVLLPTLDGTEVYRRLRASQRTQQTPVLFVTAISAHDLHLRGIADGVLLRKPFDVAELVQRVHALLSQ